MTHGWVLVKLVNYPNADVMTSSICQDIQYLEMVSENTVASLWPALLGSHLVEDQILTGYVP